MSNKIIFLAHDELKEHDVRRTVRARAAEHSHRSGERKPKVSKNPNARTRKPKQARPQDLLSRRGSTVSVATSTASIAQDANADVDTDTDSVNQASAGPSRAAAPHLTRIGGYKDDPFETYPVPAQPWFARLLDYMWPFMLRGWRVLRSTEEERQSSLKWVQRLTMSCPAYFYMNLLSVSGDLVARGELDVKMIVWHSAQVVKSINEALSDPQRALSVGTILAVGRIALHEVVVGDVNAGLTYHRPAFARMIVMAGGLQALGLPPIAQAHLGWGQRLIAMKTGVSIIDVEPGLANEPVFQEARDAEDDMAVLDTYIPKRHLLSRRENAEKVPLNIEVRDL